MTIASIADAAIPYAGPVILADDVHWAGGLTAAGTIAVAAIAVLVALISQRHADKQVREERGHADQQLAEERRLADVRLATQMEHSDDQLAEERAAADARLQKQLQHSEDHFRRTHQLALEAEQFGEASAVQVVGARVPPGQGIVSTPDNPTERPVAIVLNRGRYTITQVDARFSDGISVLPRELIQPGQDFSGLPNLLTHDLTGGIGGNFTGMLAAGEAMRFVGNATLVRSLSSIYAIVRWTDRWGQQWQHKLGSIGKVEDHEQWLP